MQFLQKGLIDRVKYLDNLGKVLQPSVVKRIQQNDKTVLQEVVVPEWMEWELLYDWARQQQVDGEGRKCVFCAQGSEVGMEFKDKWVCDECFQRLKDQR